MRRGFGWGAAILVILLLVGVGIGAYNWGVSQGLEQSGSAVQVVRYVGGHGFGFFPFFLFFPLFFLAIFALKGISWRRHWGHHDHDHDHGDLPPGPRGVEEWHRRLHEGESGGASAGGEPA